MFRIHDDEPHDPVDLLPVAALVAEGFAQDLPYAKTPREAVDLLADRLGDAVVFDRVGRKAVPWQVARELFAGREQDDQRRREAQQRNEAQAIELAERFKPRGGIPVGAQVHYDPDAA